MTPDITQRTTSDILHQPSIPDFVRDRILDLRDVVADRRLALIRASDDRSAASTARAKAQERLREVERAGKFLDTSAPPVPQLNEEIARATATMKRSSARVDELQPGYELASRLLANLETYIAAHAARLVRYEGAAPELKAGEAALDALERAARRTRTLLADRDAVRAAPFPTSVAKKVAREQLAARVEAAKPDASELVDRLGFVRFPTVPVEVIGSPSTNPINVYAVDPVGTLAWVFQKQFLAALDAEIDAVADDEHALSLEQRVEKLKIIDGDLLASEREEATFSELAGLLPRENIDPRAFLLLAASAPAPERND